MKPLTALSLLAATMLAACGEKETYPITGCDSNTQYPITCEEIGENDHTPTANPQDLNSLPNGT